MQIAMSILYMLGGVAVFMYGMKTMSLGLEQSTGSGIKRLFKKISLNRTVDYSLGIGITALLMSSSATSIMTVGLTNANIIEEKQGAGIILGAKVGTTLTAFIFALFGLSRGGFSLGAVFALIGFIGVVLIFTTKNPKTKQIALFLTGLGMLFVGLEVMEMAIGGTGTPLADALTSLFQFNFMQNPFFLIVIGTLLTAVIQSSTAAIGLFISFLLTGVITNLDQAFFLAIGANIGTCTDALLAAIGTNSKAKRIAVFHVLTSIFGALVFGLILVLAITPINNFFNTIFPDTPAFSLATFNLIYNLLYTLILLPILPLILKLMSWLIKDKSPQSRDYIIDDRILQSPAIAVQATFDDVVKMLNMAKANFALSFTSLINNDASTLTKIETDEEAIDIMTKALTAFLIKLSSISPSPADEKLIGRLHHVINDIERIADHAININNQTIYMLNHNITFTDQCSTEINGVYDLILAQFNLAIMTFVSRQTTNLVEISNLYHDILQNINKLKDTHVERLTKQTCSPLASRPLYTILLSLQRVSEHLNNIAFSVRSDTGSKQEVFAKLAKELPLNP